jgi:spore maturation protein CgeB
MRILFVDSGIGGIAERYAHDIYSTLTRDFDCEVRRIHPRQLGRTILRHFRAEVLLVVHGSLTSIEAVRYAESLGVITVLWLVEDPYEIDYHCGAMVQSYQYVFTNERQAVSAYGRPNVFYLPWCCNPRVHRRISIPPSYRSDVCFVGMGFPNRLQVINELAQELCHLKVLLIGDWEKWGLLDRTLANCVIPTVTDFWEVQRYYNGAKINLNIHRDPVDPPSGNREGIPATSPNDRVFSLAGCGAFQLVDDLRTDLRDCFVIAEELELFASVDDLWAKIQYYLSAEAEREKMAQAAQIRAYRDHTFVQRIEEVFRKINKPLLPKTTGGRHTFASGYSRTLTKTVGGVVFRSVPRASIFPAPDPGD